MSSNAQVVNLKASVQAAARLLDQATFGPTLTDINHVQAVGVNAYLTEQFAVPTTVLPAITTPPPTICATNLIPCEQSEWWQTVLTGPDQLRQRVAFALSEMFVVSTNSVNAQSVVTYQNTLANDAFANFYTIMQDVSLSPAMGGYLNMLNSAKPDGDGSQIANENYARELMQLFTTGIDMLNQDGSCNWMAAAIRFRCIRRRRCRRLRGLIRAGRMRLPADGRGDEVSAIRRTTRRRWWRSRRSMI